MSHKYKMKYSLKTERGEFDVEDVKASDMGGCDSILMISVIYPDNGSLSVQMYGEDGRTGEMMNDHEMFKVFSMMAARLAQSPELDEGRKFIVESTMDLTRKMMGITKKGRGLYATSEDIREHCDCGDRLDEDFDNLPDDSGSNSNNVDDGSENVLSMGKGSIPTVKQ